MVRTPAFTSPSVALTTPAVRMVAVAVWVTHDPAAASGWHTDVEFHPVLAISAVIEEDGHVAYYPLIMSPDTIWGVMPVDAALADVNGGYQVVTAPWPAEEDKERLTGLVVDLENHAIGKATEAFFTTLAPIPAPFPPTPEPTP